MSIDSVVKTVKRGGYKRGLSILVLTEVNNVCHILLVSSRIRIVRLIQDENNSSESRNTLLSRRKLLSTIHLIKLLRD